MDVVLRSTTNFLAIVFAITGPGNTIVWSQNVTLGPQEDLSKLKVNSIVAVNFSGSGLAAAYSGLVTLHVRAACVDLWKHLAETDERVSFVTGPPGIGKSIEVYGYALWEAHTHHKRVLYIHGGRTRYSIVLASAGTNNMRFGGANIDKEPQFLLDSIITFLERREVDIVVLDGRVSWLILSVFDRLLEFPDVRMISCTSFQALSNISTEDLEKAPDFSEFVMDSWKKEEYDAAIASGALVLHSPSLTVDEMFYYAGGSIRMIKWPVEKVIKTLTRKVQKSPDMGKLIGAGGVGDSSQSAVNSLMSTYGGQSSVLSKFVTVMMLNSVSDDLIEKSRAALPYNPPFQGWVTEMEVLNLAQKRPSMLFRNVSGGMEEWPRLRPSNLPLPIFFSASDPRLSDSKLDWLVPLKYNQECFDAIYRVSLDTVRAIQITNADRHSCNLKYLIPFVEAMNVHIVELVYVCRRSNFDTFKVPTPERKPKGRAKTKDSKYQKYTGLKKKSKAKKYSEHRQYIDLLDTITKIWQAKCNSNDHFSYPDPAIIIRHVTYEQKDRDRPLNNDVRE